MRPATITTFKTFTIPVGFTFNGMDMVTSGAGLTCISGWYEQQFYKGDFSFVCCMQSQAVKCPVVCFSSLLLGAGLFVKRLSDVSQILKNQCSTDIFSFGDKLFRYIMVDPIMSAAFSTREPFKQATRRLSAFALNASSDSTIFIPNNVKLLPREKKKNQEVFVDKSCLSPTNTIKLRREGK